MSSILLKQGMLASGTGLSLQTLADKISVNMTETGTSTETATAVVDAGVAERLLRSTVHKDGYALYVKDHLSKRVYACRISDMTTFAGLTKEVSSLYLLTKNPLVNWPPTGAIGKRVILSPDVLSVPVTGGLYVVTVDVENQGTWTVASVTGPATCNVSSGIGVGMVVLTVPSNATGNTRAGVVTVSCGTATATLTYTQDAVAVVEVLSPSASITLTAGSFDSGYISVNVASDGTTTITPEIIDSFIDSTSVYPMSSRQWDILAKRKLDIQDGAYGLLSDTGVGITVNVMTKTQYNALSTPRPKTELYLIVETAPTGDETFFLRLDPPRGSYSQKHLSDSFYIFTNKDAEWSISVPSGHGISVSPTSGTGPGVVVVTLTSNPERLTFTDVITVTSGTTTEDYTISYKQAEDELGLFLYPSPATVDYLGRYDSTEFGWVNGLDVQVDSPSRLRWKVDTFPSWVTTTALEYTNATRTSFTMSRNLTGSSRIGNIVFVSEDYPEIGAVLTVTQTACPGLQVTPTVVTMPPSGGVSTIHVSTRPGLSGWVLVGTPPAWITPSKSSGPDGEDTFTLTISDIGSNTTRSANVVVAIADDANTTATIAVSQSARSLLMWHESGGLITDPAGRTDTVTLQTIGPNESWELYGSLPSWITPSSSSGAGDADIALEIDTNTIVATRQWNVTGRLTNYTTKNDYITVQQGPANPEMTITTSSLSFIPDGGQKTLSLSANMAWTATASGTGFSVSPTSGTSGASQTITVTAAANTGAGTRSGSVFFTTDGAVAEGLSEVTHDCTLSQTAYSVQLGADLSFVAAGESKSLSVTANGSWTATVSGTGFSITGATNGALTGSGNSTLTIVASSNTGDSRTGSVSLTCAGTSSDTANLSQASGSSYTVTLKDTSNNTSWAPDADAHSLNMAISPTGTGKPSTWSLASDQSWLTIAANGSIYADPYTAMRLTEAIYVTAANNMTTSSRSATLTATLGSQTSTYSVTQSAANNTLTISQTSLSFAAAGEAKSGITLTTGGAPTLSNVTITFPSWLTAWNNLTGTIISGGSYPKTASLTLTAAANDPIANSGTVTITYGSASSDISVSQAASEATIYIGGLQAYFASTGEQQAFDLTSNVDWTAWVTGEGFSLGTSESSGTGNATLHVTVANNTGAERYGSLDVVGPASAGYGAAQNSITATVSLVQYAGSGGGSTLSGSGSGSGGGTCVGSAGQYGVYWVGPAKYMFYDHTDEYSLVYYTDGTDIIYYDPSGATWTDLGTSMPIMVTC